MIDHIQELFWCDWFKWTLMRLGLEHILCTYKPWVWSPVSYCVPYCSVPLDTSIEPGVASEYLWVGLKKSVMINFWAILPCLSLDFLIPYNKLLDLSTKYPLIQYVFISTEIAKDGDQIFKIIYLNTLEYFLSLPVI